MKKQEQHKQHKEIEITGFWVTVVSKEGKEYLYPLEIEYLSPLGEDELYKMVKKGISKIENY